ncbi:MAG: 50S ribosomal protein L25/general stress protein Ctc [Bacteroidetes bacterium]|jgi:large subunit ribosomal protein L25|nr:50S ribosomal protein L25/general stress protein Ctc [Bacteroidota bacterium]
MKTVSMSGSLRENVGKKDAKALRNAGKVPCVLYGGKEQIHFTTEIANFKPILFTPNTYLIKIKIQGTVYQTILQDVQYHPVSDNLLHADFLLIQDDKPVTVALPVVLKGAAPGVLRGGRLKIKLAKLKLKGLLKDIPEFIEINVSKLEIGQSVKVRDLNIKNITMLSPASAVIADVKTARGAALGEDGEEEAEGEGGEEGAGEAEESKE